MYTRVETRLDHPGYLGHLGLHVCYGQVDLIHFIKYPGLIQILHWIMCVDNGI